MVLSASFEINESPITVQLSSIIVTLNLSLLWPSTLRSLAITLKFSKELLLMEGISLLIDLACIYNDSISCCFVLL